MSTVPLQQIYDNRLTAKGLTLHVLRLDQVNEQLNGNKWYKLKYNLERAKLEGKKVLLSFGGAFSNHVYALAAAGKQFGFETHTIIRGERTEPLNLTLQFAEVCGMKLFYVDRGTYRSKEKCVELWEIANPGLDPYMIPEGGANEEGVKGSMEIVSEIKVPFNNVVCACGTGTMLAGISMSLKEDQRVIGIPVLKGGEFLSGEIEKYASRKNWELRNEYHFGGYAKTTPELLQFMTAFEKQHRIPLDHVYTGKLMYAVMDLVENDQFKKGDVIIDIHSGGLQGRIRE